MNVLKIKIKSDLRLLLLYFNACSPQPPVEIHPMMEMCVQEEAKQADVPDGTRYVGAEQN